MVPGLIHTCGLPSRVRMSIFMKRIHASVTGRSIRTASPALKLEAESTSNESAPEGT